MKNKTALLLSIAALLVIWSASAAQDRTIIQKKSAKKVAAQPQTSKFKANFGKYDFTFRTLDGKKIRLSDLSGKVILVNIWAPWCEPCSKEAKGFVNLYKKYRSKGFEILGVAVRTDADEVNKFADKYGVTWPLGIKNDITKLYGSIGLPQSYLFGPNGTLLKEFVGYADEEALALALEEALKFVKNKP